MSDEDFPRDRLDRILKAVETIEESLGILVEKRSDSREEYRADSEIQDVVERRFVKMTEASIDIGEELVKNERGRPPSSNPATMFALEEIGVLPSEAADKMAQSARFRNVLSHTYGRSIDDDLVYNALHDLERYRLFVEAVRDYLDENGVLEE